MNFLDEQSFNKSKKIKKPKKIKKKQVASETKKVNQVLLKRILF